MQGEPGCRNVVPPMTGHQMTGQNGIFEQFLGTIVSFSECPIIRGTTVSTNEPGIKLHM